ncbi:hypothetical protein NUW58_g2295 [Xylaria curta]|uniref:Uncharacterized protein n=1 Tax=Xylaria curta TaxID=42375 RepID=A0ACC1PGB9_9PEZI|nr:hypothetical protein NUW58_g2295 [Xylaria curta]
MPISPPIGCREPLLRKDFLSPPTSLRLNRVKRPFSDVAQGGIVLYPGSKKPRNGYNMAPPSRETLSRSTPASLYTPTAIAQAPSRTQSPSPSSEDGIHEGLVNSVNDVFRRRQIHRTGDYMEQGFKLVGRTPFFLLDETEPGEVRGYEPRVGNGDSRAPPTATTPLISCASALGSNASGGMNGEVKHEPMSAGAAPAEENQIETDVRAGVAVSLSRGSVWEIPKSPGQPDALENGPDAGLFSDKKLQPAKRRGRPPKFSRVPNIAEVLPDDSSATEKRKQGRPRKQYPRLRNESDKDYVTRIARLRKKSIPRALDMDAQQPGLSSSVPNIAIAANELEEISQSGDTDTSNCVSSLIQDQSCNWTASDLNNSSFAQKRETKPRVEPDEHVMRPADHAGPIVWDDNIDEQTGDFRSDNSLAQCEPVGGGDDDDDNDTEDDNKCNDSGTLSDLIDGYDTDTACDDVDQSTEDSFEHDVDAFNARQIRHTEDEESFEGPLNDDVLAIHLDHQPLRDLCKLVGNSSWAGMKGNWQWRRFDYDGIKTMPARALLPVLAKLERLYQATPKAPRLEAQNRFLREHASMLRFYFRKIKTIVEHIHTQRLETPDRNKAAHNTDPRKRERITRDLVLYIIPMLTHVLVSAWGLGGESWRETSFTNAAVEVLKRTFGWIMLLHRRLLRELERCPIEKEPESDHQKQAWRRRNAKREEIGPLLNALFQVIAAAPAQLVEAKTRTKMELQRRQQQLRRERQLKMEQKAAEEARRVAEQKKRSLLSIRGIHYPLRSSTSSEPSPMSAEWSLEEQRLLILRIQASYPSCPDLDNLRWELNKTLAQMVIMTKHLLGKMLDKVLIGYSAEERAAEVRRIMDSSGVAGA